MTDSLKKAINIVGQAIVADKEGRLDDALTLYMASFEWFNLALKYGKNEKTSQMVREKMVSYVKRAEEIKNQVNHPVAHEPEADTDDLRQGLSNSVVSKSPNVKWTTSPGWKRQRPRSKKQLFYQSDARSCLKERESRGKEFCCMVRLVQGNHILLKR